MVKIIAVPRETLDLAWPDVEKYIQMALDEAGGEMLIDDVYNYVKSDKYILLMPYENEPLGAVTLEIQTYPRKRKVGVVHVGGKDVKKWVSQMWDAIVRLANEQKADSITWQGRQGWVRFMRHEIDRNYHVCEVNL
jgi:hypothetical protein